MTIDKGIESEHEFKIGDPVVYPARGAGIVETIVDRPRRGGREPFYRIRLLGQKGTTLLVPAKAAEGLGLRRAIPEARLVDLWHVLAADPRELPDDRKARYNQLEEELHTGDTFEVAGALRDLVSLWRENHLTARGRQIHNEAMAFLVAEVAASQAIDLERARAQVGAELGPGPTSA